MSNVGWTSADAVDWNEVSTEPPPPLNPALYKGLIVKAEPSPTKENKPAIAIELQIDKEYGGPDVSPVRKMFDNLTLTKEAAFKVKQLAAAANVAPPANFGIDAVRAFCDSLVRRTTRWIATSARSKPSLRALAASSRAARQSRSVASAQRRSA
jgi:hypothetical protein